MDIDSAREFVRTHHRAVLATRTSSGVQQSPVLVGVGSRRHQGRLGSPSAAGDRRRRPRTSAGTRGRSCAFSTTGFFGDWIYVEGEAEVVSLPEAMEPLVEYYRGISGEADGLGRVPRRHGARAEGDPPRHADAGRAGPPG